MFPILYESIKTGTVPAHNGLGVLSDCTACYVEQERNGKYELVMEYPANGIHAEDIGYRRLIKAKPNYTDNPQLFRIDRIGKVMRDGNFSVYAKHISYDLSGFEIMTGEAINAAEACVLFENATKINPEDENEKYTIRTTKETVAAFKINTPGSIKSYFAGKEGSFLDIYGPAEIKYDNFRVDFLTRAGRDNVETIRYGKNLLELSQETDCSNLYTAVVCFYKTQDGDIITGEKVATGLTLDAPRVLVLDATGDFQETPEESDLTARATQYKNSNNLTTPTDNIKLDFVQSGELTGRVDLCDTVSIYYEALGITRAQVKCIRTKWDVLLGKYTETEFGDVQKSLASTITENKAAAASAMSEAGAAMEMAGSKKRVFVGAPEPPYDEGDLWVNGEDIYYCSTPRGEDEEFQESDWTLASAYTTRDRLQEAITEASEIITGTTGGNVVLHLNQQGQPYEILILDKDDQSTPTTIDNAERVWRWNAGGLGFSGSGYNNLNYTTALTRDGKFNADIITTGHIDASTGIIQHLTASVFEGGKITLGGLNNQEGVFELKNAAGLKIGEMTSDGLKFYGPGPEGQRPYVKLNNEVGFAGFDKNDTPLFWVAQDEFRMKKCVAEEEINACGLVKYIPVTIRDPNTQEIINQGVAEVAIVE